MKTNTGNREQGTGTGDFQSSNLLSYVADTLTEVSKMERPLDAKQARELINRYGFNAVISQLEKMENYKKLNQYRSAYLTCVKWFEMDIKKGWFVPEKKIEFKTESGRTNFVKNFLLAHPIGSDITINGQQCTVETEIFIRTQNERLLPIADLFNNNTMEVK